MSGFLRRIKRSRAADTGEPPPLGLHAGPEGARTAETSAADASSAKTSELPAGAAVADASGTVIQTGPGAAGGSDSVVTEKVAETRPGAVAGADAALAGGPVVQAARGTPAGLDPTEAGAKVATGRRGRLRRRLRYLRRARELMLRDLGGLLYEVHRTAGGDVAAHTATIGAKVERLTALDAETAAIETALGATRGQAVVFEPGIGGTCDICGELYGSAARFCSNCGAPAGATARAPAPPAEPGPVPAKPRESADDNRPRADASGPATADAPPATDEDPPREPPDADGTPPGVGDPPNGRAKPGLSPDDPLAAKRSSS